MKKIKARNTPTRGKNPFDRRPYSKIPPLLRKIIEKGTRQEKPTTNGVRVVKQFMPTDVGVIKTNDYDKMQPFMKSLRFLIKAYLEEGFLA